MRYEEDSGEHEYEASGPEEDQLIRGLVILPGSPRAGEHFLLDQDELTIGRRPDADLFLDDRSVSRAHARLVREDDGATASTTSTRATEPLSTAAESTRMRLEDGDEIQLGVYAVGYIERA